MERDNENSANDRSPPPPPNPGFLSQIFIWWMNPLLYKGFSKRALEHSDLYRLQQENKASVLQEKFEKYWNEELRESSYMMRKPSMIRPIWRCFCGNILEAGGYSVVAAGLGIANALLIGFVVEGIHKESSGHNNTRLPYLVLALCLCSYTAAICYHRFQYIGLVTGMQLRIALTSLVYKKVRNTHICTQIPTCHSTIVIPPSNPFYTHARHPIPTPIPYIPILLLYMSSQSHPQSCSYSYSYSYWYSYSCFSSAYTTPDRHLPIRTCPPTIVTPTDLSLPTQHDRCPTRRLLLVLYLLPVFLLLVHVYSCSYLHSYFLLNILVILYHCCSF